MLDKINRVTDTSHMAITTYKLEANQAALDWHNYDASGVVGIDRARSLAKAIAEECGERVKVRDEHGREVCHFNYDGSED